MSDAVINRILAETAIPGMDIPEALSRMGNNPKLYMRIIHSFTTNMPSNLAEIATSGLTAATLTDYGIRVHGAKGSCYGIGANAVGDFAKRLEMAAKSEDLQTCLRSNDDFIAETRRLIVQLEALEAKVTALENPQEDKPQAIRPDLRKLDKLLSATQRFDIDEMGRLIDELTSKEYVQDGDMVQKIKSGFEAYDYQYIEEILIAYL
ncbi:MAG: hypothetical protein LBP91_00780 [Coriobacteriales bacterium]|jgi:HPt (histidine-containing phosphotransfer) domain-containing protein|nr:hypothetical protein [Coriobacteriales bacterium]